MRNITKTVKHEIDGKEFDFEIKKMNALDGSKLLKFVIEKLLPAFTKIQGIIGTVAEGEDVQKIAMDRTQDVLNMIPEILSSLSDEELVRLEKMCLQTVQIRMPAGWQPVMTGDNFGIDELEYETLTILLLCYEVIEFNTESFFGGKSLTSILNPQNT